MVLAIVGMALVVLALALFGRVVNSTADLVRLLRTSNAPAAMVPIPAGDAAVVDAGSLIDASLAAVNALPSSRAVLPTIEPALEASVHASEAIPDGDASMDEEISDASSALPLNAVGTIPSDATDASVRPERDAVSDVATEPVHDAPPPVRCGFRICPEGQLCCNWNCSECVAPGGTCSPFCGAPMVPISAPCGPNTCNVGEVCCNASCGTCVPSGGTCSKEPCAGPYLPVSATCGMNTCNAGQVCCNPSCGICVNPGETCSLVPCLR